MIQAEFRSSGIYLPELDLWLDAKEDCAFAWLSHAHVAPGPDFQGMLFGTELTRELASIPCTYRAVEYEQAWEWNGARLTAYPNGHLLGAAQLLIEFEGERLVYTGHLKQASPIACDRLIMECNFGLPIYHFLSREAASERIAAFTRECFEAGLVPALAATALGPCQEVIQMLCTAGIPVVAPDSVTRYFPVYERAGYHFTGCETLNGTRAAGKAFVAAPDFFQNGRKDYRLADVSGNALLDSARARFGAEELIPFSPHAGFDELIAYVEASGARHVDLTEGYTEIFAHILRERGIDAHAHGTH